MHMRSTLLSRLYSCFKFRGWQAVCLSLALVSSAVADTPTWTKVTPPEVTAAGIGVQLTGADYGNGVFVLAAYFGGTPGNPASPAVFTSPDGTTWTRRSLPGGVGGRTGAPRFLNGKFLLGVTPDTQSGGNGVIVSSTDGITWTASSSLGGTINAPGEFAFGNNLYVAPIANAASQIATSTDGVTWTLRTISAGGASSHVTFFKGKFYATNYNTGAGLYSSADGIVWTKVAGAPASPGILAASDTTLLVTFFSGSTSGQSVSKDGATFTTASPGITLKTETIKYLNGAFVVTDSVSATVFDLSLAKASTDGNTWTAIGSTANQYYAPEVAFGAGARYVFVGEFDVYAGGTSTNPGGGGTSVASYAGTYTGKIGSKVTTGGNVTLNPALADYTVTISSGGNVTANIGALTPAMIGTIDASGAITFTSGTGISLYNILTATVSGGVLSSDYGAQLGTTGAQYRFEPPAGVTVAPTISVQPLSQFFVLGGSVTLTVTASGTGLTYQWYFNGIALGGQVNASLILTALTALQAGDYTVKITNAGGSVTSAAATLTLPTPSNAGRIVNMSVRASAGAGDQTLIVGVIIGGKNTAGKKDVLFRAAGPSLSGLGIVSFLADPKLTAFAGGSAVDSNDNWAGDATILAAAARVGAFAFTGASSKDSALYASPDAGAYSLHVTGGTTGIALAEIYDATTTFTAASPRLVNVSARALVGTGDNLLIAGFVIGGSTPRNVLIRALGPKLTGSGVGGVLADPKITLYARGAKVAENDNWSDATNATDVVTATAQVGATALTSGSKDAVLLVSLEPGVYSAQVTGVGGTTGVALVELFEAP